MINDDEELKVVRTQLHLVEDALAALRRDVLPKNKRNYETLAEGYIEQILTLRREIDEFLGFPKAPFPGDAAVSKSEGGAAASISS